MSNRKSLLAITPTYNYFVKDQIESISSDFKSIDVFVYPTSRRWHFFYETFLC
jgi:hypothetical protein